MSLKKQLAQLVFDGQAVVAALIEKPAPGVHAASEHVVVEAHSGFAGDHARKSWWKGEDIPGRHVTAMAAEVLDVLGVEAAVPGDNLITRGVDLSELQEGDQLQVGTVRLMRSVKPHKPCHLFAQRTSEEAKLAVAASNTRGALFTVDTGGDLRVGDVIRIIRREEA